MQSLLSETIRAQQRIKPYILQTPLIPSLYLSRISGAQVYLKMESEQYTCSFKARGAINKVLSSLVNMVEFTGPAPGSAGSISWHPGGCSWNW